MARPRLPDHLLSRPRPTGRKRAVKLSPKAYTLGLRPSAVLATCYKFGPRFRFRIKDEDGWLGVGGNNGRAAWASAAKVVRAMEERVKHA